MDEIAGENKRERAHIYMIERTQPRDLPVGERLSSRTPSVINPPLVTT